MKTSIKFALMSAIFLSAGCSHANKISEGTSSMTDLNNAKDWCAGRYTIKIPKSAVPFAGGDKYNSFEIKSTVGANLRDLSSEYASDRSNMLGKSSTIFAEPAIKKMGNKSVQYLDFKAGTIKGAPNTLLLYVLDRNVLFSIKLSYMPAIRDQVYVEMNKVIENIQARSPNTIPNEKGVCIANGFIKDSDSLFRKSTHTIAFQFNDQPSLKVSLQVDAVNQPFLDLVTRTEQNLKKDGMYHLTSTSLKTIRKGEKNQTGGDHLKGLEWVNNAPMKGRDGIVATWEHAGIPVRSFDPVVQFNLNSGYNSGNIKTSSMAENEALKLYDQILNTIKKF